ncbi:MAG TPA: ABC transporter permease subunit, partial [Candidatus Limnocylindrales bacterium]
GGQFLDPKGNLSTGYALLPPIWGTVLVTGIAVAIGLPISLALAVIAVDFPMGPIGRLVRPMVSVFSGIPPVVYAVSVPLFVTAFMIPKFAANMTYDQFTAGGPAAIGADPSTWPPPGVPYSPGAFPWTPTEANSVLLGGLLVGLFLIPFVTPIFVDALANVPRAAREASLALGANRTYTLRRVVLPRALPAIAGAGTLAMLKAMGDSVIVLFAVGFAAGFPTPPFDVLERSAPLGAWGANLIGSFDTLSATCNPQACAVGYTSALLLLVIAGVAVVALTWLQARARRRVAV